MKYLYSLLWLCTVFFFSCNGGLPDAEETEGEIEIFPDYPVGCITVYCGEVRLIDNIKY